MSRDFISLAEWQQIPHFQDDTHPLKSGLWSGAIQLETRDVPLIETQILIPDLEDEEEEMHICLFDHPSESEDNEDAVLSTPLSNEDFAKGLIHFFLPEESGSYLRCLGRVSTKDHNLITGTIERISNQQTKTHYNLEEAGCFSLHYQEH